MKSLKEFLGLKRLPYSEADTVTFEDEGNDVGYVFVIFDYGSSTDSFYDLIDRSSDPKPLFVSFGRTGCGPCTQLKPV